jgi:hypothetical protein
MLEERRKWEYYLVYSTVTDNPIFPSEKCKELFEVFKIFAEKDPLFKLHPQQVLQDLKLARIKPEEKFPFKNELFEKMSQTYKTGVAFNEFLSFIVSFTLGEYITSHISPSAPLVPLEALTSLISSRKRSDQLNAREVKLFCEEFNCKEVEDVLVKALVKCDD